MKLPENREKIRVGQFWRKKDIGLLVQITGKGRSGYAYKKVGDKRTKTRGHRVFEKDLYLFWERV